MKKIFLGLFFIMIAVLILLNQMGYLINMSIFKLLITVFAGAWFIRGIIRKNFFGIFMPLAILGTIYASELQITNFSPMPILLIALFLSIGFSIMFKKRYFCHQHRGFERVINEEDDEEVNVENKFSSSVKYINSDNLKKVNLYSSFGAMKVYFDNAKIEKDLTINLDISFSGVELYIPKEYKIINKADVSLGGIDEKNKRDVISKKTITITGKVSFAGVEIIYV